MEKKKFIEHIVESKEEIVEVLEIDSLKDEVEALKKEMEMLGFFKKFFQDDENKNDNKINELKEQNKKLLNNIQSSKEMILNLEKVQKQQELNNLNLKEENATLQDKLKKAQKTPLNKLQTLYNSLSSTTKLGIKNSLHSDDPLTLFTSGILHIEPLWEYAKYLLQEEKLEDFEILREIFYMLFESYKDVEDLEYQKVSVGEEFDSHIHIRDAKSEPAGSIQVIQLKGFCTEDGEVVKKTIVRVL